MRETFTRLYAHIVWATWDRLPLLTEEAQALAYACIRRECEALRAPVRALSGTENHVHLLVCMPPAVSVSALVKQIKGSSSRLINKHKMTDDVFKWQGSYSAFAVSPWDVAKIQGYILRQKEHHHQGTTKPALEDTGEDSAPARS